MAGAGLLAAVHRQPVIFSLCILLAGGAALWRQRRRAVSRQRSEIVLPPEDFQGQWFWSAGIPTVCFPGVRRTAKPVTAGIYGETARSNCRAGAVPAAARPALVSQVSVLLAVVPEHHLREHLAQSLRDWRRSIVECRTRLNGLPPVWSVFWVTPPRPQGKAAGLPSRRRGPAPCAAEGQAPQSVAGWQREGSPASRLHQTLWLESILTLAENALFRPFRARQAELPPLNLCAAGICLTPVAAVANNLWQQQIAAITTLSPGNDAAPCPHPLPDLLLSSLPHRHGVSRRMRDAGLAAGVGFLFLALAMLASFINNQRRCAASAIIWRCITASAARRRRRSCRRSSVCVPTAACWMTGCAGEPLRYRLGLYQGRLIPFVEAAINDWAPPRRRVRSLSRLCRGRRRSASIAWRCSIPANRR